MLVRWLFTVRSLIDNVLPTLPAKLQTCT
jgi:hypothetical protein